jgi:hypothetical protein
VAEKDQSRFAKAVPFVLAAIAIAAVAYFLIKAPEESPLGTETEATDADGGLEDDEITPRCREVGAKRYRIGKASHVSDAGEEEEPEPFGVEVGRSAALSNGYAVGVRREDKGSLAEVVVLDARAEQGKVFSLGRSRGDMDPPIVRPRGKDWAAAMLEPHAGGLALRLASHEGDKVVWGAELEQGADESLAYDIAFNGKVGVVTWDDVTEDGKRGRIMLATVDAKNLKKQDEPIEVSSENVDAELPRLVSRRGGFWLAYSARSRSPQKTQSVDAGDPDRFAAERIEPSWIELVALDASGKLDGTAQAVTAKDGFVLAFDLELGKGDSALLAWRDDDTPTGAGGGRLTLILVGTSGSSQRQPIAAENLGAGAPVLMPKWLAISDGEGNSQLAPVGDDGDLEGELRRETLVGGGQFLATRGSELLVARPQGRAMEFLVLSCTREAAPDAGAAPAQTPKNEDAVEPAKDEEPP